MFLAILVYFKANLLTIKLFNCLFIFLAVVLVCKSIKIFITEIKAFFLTLLLGLYYPLLASFLPYILTEALSLLLISFFAYNFILFFQSNMKKHLFFAGFSLGYLILTKIIFAYVIFFLFIIFTPLLFSKRTLQYAKKYILILGLSFCVTVPYLVYTYSLTNKIFYYGNSGGMSLYWMSTPHDYEFGDWHSFVTLAEKPKLYNNHIDFLTTIEDLHPVEKDIALKEKAIENIKKNKLKFLKNWLFNVSRIFFNHPFSTDVEPSDSLVLNYIYNVLLILFLLTTMLLTCLFIKKVDPIFYFLGGFVVIYLGGISLLSAYPRFLHIILPIILIWIGYTMNKFVQIKVKIKTK